jgi:hypothetical protein
VFAYQIDPGPTGTRVDDYSTRIPEAAMLPVMCGP